MTAKKYVIGYRSATGELRMATFPGQYTEDANRLSSLLETLSKVRTGYADDLIDLMGGEPGDTRFVEAPSPDARLVPNPHQEAVVLQAENARLQTTDEKALAEGLIFEAREKGENVANTAARQIRRMRIAMNADRVERDALQAEVVTLRGHTHSGGQPTTPPMGDDFHTAVAQALAQTVATTKELQTLGNERYEWLNKRLTEAEATIAALKSSDYLPTGAIRPGRGVLDSFRG